MERLKIDRMFINALKSADSLVLRWDEEKDRETGIELTKRATDQDKVRDPFIQDKTIYFETRGWIHGDNGFKKAVAVRFLYPRSDIFGLGVSLARVLRPEDELEIEWYPGAHTTANLEDAGLHGDVVFLLVFRKDKPLLRIEVESSICEDNGVRMFRRF